MHHFVFHQTDSYAMPRLDGHTQGSDAMDLAARKYHVHVVRALIKSGADPTLPVDGGRSPLEMMPGVSGMQIHVYPSPAFSTAVVDVAQSWTNHDQSTKVTCRKS